MSSAGRAANSSGCVARPKERAIGLIGFAEQIQRSSLIGSCAMEAAEHREPCESRGSCTDLGAPGGEIPPGDSTSAFRLSTHYSVDVAHGLVLLYGIGTKAVPSWDSKTRWNNLLGDLAVNVTAGSSGCTISPHPSSREGHHSTARWSSSVL